MRLTSTRVLLFTLFGLLVTGCDGCLDFFDGGDDPPSVTEAGVGDACTSDGNCRLGLACRTGFCAPAGTSVEGALCRLSGECAPGLYCGGRRVCETAGTAAVDENCESTTDCTPGLLCSLSGFSLRCAEAGTADLGDTCANTAGCLAGLSCGDATGRMVCASPAPTVGPTDGGVPLPPATIPFWAGERCGGDVSEVRAYFDVPRGVPADGDFYRLPFPNDARRTATGLDLGNHPHPGTALSVDVIDRYLRASEEDLRGFSTNPAIYFRFSRPYDWASLDGALELVDITPGSPTYGQPSGLAWLTTAGMITKYICPNWMAMRTPHGAPLRPGTTYAAILSTAVRPEPSSGTAFARAPDFAAVLAPTAPADTALAGAYTAYAPLRDYLADIARDPATLLTAAVFTTQPVEDIAQRLREVIRAAAAPTLSDVTVCAAGVTSPCDDGTPQRACVAEGPDFVEVHGRIALPIFQQGTAPYENPEDGGGIARDASGAPTVARTENVCFALTIPKAPMPIGGWPLMLYAHGTGGSFRGAASDLATDVSSASSSVRAATLAIDLPEHGARRGASTRAPQELFYNFANPRAARDNVMQGAADLYSLVYFASSYAADAMRSPTGEALDFDASRIVLFAHSQGATHASLMLPWESELAAVVLSGNGGDLTQSLLTKTQPVNIARVLPLALLDFDGTGALSGGEWHPVLGLFQQYFDSVDPVNYARRFAYEPPTGDLGRHLFMTYGPGDTYSTEATMQSLSRAAGFPIVRPVLVDFGLAQVDAPLSANRTVGTSTRTQGLRQYTPEDGEDGHFVSTRTTAGRADTLRFVRGALAGETPIIGE